MNKTAIKNVATFARKELINQVTLRAQFFGITPKGSGKLEVGSDYVQVNGQSYPKSFQQPYEALLKEIEKKGFQQVVEEVAYTWFNRLVALRFMEVNDYLPSKIRVLSSMTPGKVDPDILTMYRDVDFPVDEAYVQEMLNKGDREAAYKHLLIVQCNQFSEIMPFLFERTNHYSELLFPVLLNADSFVNRMVREIDEEDFTEVEIIGWMYQYYISEKKNEIFAKLKKNVKIAKQDIPAATQLFTPEWIVKYMVENSVGRLWLDSHPESAVKENWRYYIEPAEQTKELQEKLDALKNPSLTPEDIKIIDPACGSGHMLVYAFDLLYEIYEEAGYPKREISYLILENNLYGLDIDGRAVQLASFALMMKARSRARRLFNNPPVINVLSIQETNGKNHGAIAKQIANGDEERYQQIYCLQHLFVDAKNKGSLIRPPIIDYEYFETRIGGLLAGQIPDLFEVTFDELKFMQQILKQAKFLSTKYDVVVTNPPYMGTKGLNSGLSEFVKENYPITKMDLFAAFMERSLEMNKKGGFNSAINQHSWMFLGSYEDFREQLLNKASIQSMVHLGPKAFEEIGGEVVQSTAYVLKCALLKDYMATYHRLIDVNNSSEKEVSFLQKDNVYVLNQNSFSDIPGCPIAYWASDQVREIFIKCSPLKDLAEPRAGLQTSNNERFLRLWHEVMFNKIGFGFDKDGAKFSKLKWFPYNKGGDYRKWYGNQKFIVNWENDGYEIKQYLIGKNPNIPRCESFYFREGITWPLISSSHFSVRCYPKGMLFDVVSHSLFCLENDYLYFTSLLNTRIANEFLKILNPTLAFSSGVVAKLPILKTQDEKLKNKINLLAKANISISKIDWDSFETSWDFEYHPFLKFQNGLSQINEIYGNWKTYTEVQFYKIKENEEELNRIFIKIYGLEDELIPEVPDEEITIHRANQERESKSFLSYAVGCMMGRYSLDIPGLAYAGGEFDWSKYQRFIPDQDGIIPITDKIYFEDDIVDRLAQFLTVTFGEETLQENLHWLAESLTMKKNETPTERLRRYFMDEFYKDHLKTYQKRPIYWLFDSGRKKGFRALVYLHRYNPQTLAKMRLDYLQELQVKYNNEEQLLLQRLEQPNLSRTEKTATNRRLEEIRGRQRELVDYDNLLADFANHRIALDLDDGVVVNYAKLETLLAKIR